MNGILYDINSTEFKDELKNVLDHDSSGEVCSSLHFRLFMENHHWDGTLVANVPEMIKMMNVNIIAEGKSWVIINEVLPYPDNYDNDFALKAAPSDDVDVDIDDVRKEWNSYTDDEKRKAVKMILDPDVIEDND